MKEEVEEEMKETIKQEEPEVMFVPRSEAHVAIVYHVTIVAIGYLLLKKFCPMVIGCVLLTAYL